MIRNTILTTLLVLSFMLSKAMAAGTDEGYQIKVKITGLKDTVCYLGYYFNDKQYVLDTARIDKTGNFEFKKKKKLDRGLYFLYSPEKTFLQILISDEQKFSVETDTTKLVEHLKITGSNENKLFNEFQLYRMKQYDRVQALKTRLDKNKGVKDSTEYLSKQIENVDKEVMGFMNDKVAKYPKTLYAAIMKSNLQVDIPDSPKDASGKELDTLFALHYLQKHFFDNIDFSEPGLIRTPILYQKVMDYIKRLVVPDPDSITRSCIFMLEKSKADTQVFHFMLPTLTNYYETSKYMGMDAVFVNLAEKYYLTGQAYWADSTMLAKMTERVLALKPTLLGKLAHEMILTDTLNRRISMHAIKAKYTILFFYEPDCGHCKKSAPKVKLVYDKFKSKDVKLYAACIKTDVKEWKEFINKFKLDNDCINVSDPNRQSDYRAYYDIYSTPVIYLLDKDKKILAKRLSPSQLEDMLNHEFGLKDKVVKEDKDDHPEPREKLEK